MSGHPAVQSLWIGASLSIFERLTIASYLANGHDFHLYTYEAVAGVPEGATILDAGRILPPSRIFRYRGNGSFAGFSNFFRYRLLLEKGGWWVDLDTVCLRPFAFDTDYVFSSEIDKDVAVINAAAIKAPPGSRLAEYAWRVCEAKDISTLRWGETGPRLLADAVSHAGLRAYVQPPQTFCPTRYPEWRLVIDPNGCRDFGPDVYAIHLWNEMWRHHGQDKDGTYPASCLLERLKSRYLGSNASA